MAFSFCWYKGVSLPFCSACCVLLFFAVCQLFSSFQRAQSFVPESLLPLYDNNFALASRQSYGFFDDIPNDTWERMRRKAHSFVQYKNPTRPYTGFEDPIMWYYQNLQPVFTCPHVQRVGGHGDGPKWTCDPHRLMNKQDCLVYSVGCEGDYQWEDGLIQELGGPHCEIHVFDPGSYARNNDPQQNNIHYHQWGLTSSYEAYYPGSLTNEKLGSDLMTFQETRAKLGHENRTIDIFKIDCEKCEWANYKDWIQQDIHQILIETHGVPSPIRGNDWHAKPMNVAEFFDAFVENHFAMFSKEVNPIGGGNCIEFSFIKLHRDFWRKEEVEHAALMLLANRDYSVPIPSEKRQQVGAMQQAFVEEEQRQHAEIDGKASNGS